jgi:hypothetical protein
MKTRRRAASLLAALTGLAAAGPASAEHHEGDAPVV